MTDFDLTVRNGTIVTAADTLKGDIGIKAGKIVALAEKLPAGTRDLDAAGRYVLPGGIDSHCHVEQLSASGMMTADDFYSATVSAAFGGTTTIIPFAAQHRGMSLPKVVADYHACAGPKAVIDYGFHLIVSDPTEQALRHDLPALISQGYTSFKVYMTYDKLKIDDYALLDVAVAVDAARENIAAGRVKITLSGGQLVGEGDDLAGADANVALQGVAGRDDGAVADG